MKVLIVDDSKTMRNIVKNSINTLGATAVEEAGDGVAALAKLETFHPELILCDWNMPVMDGITFVRQCRAKGLTTPIIMVTTEAEKVRVIEAIKAGVNNYVAKPFTHDDLRRVVAATMEKAKAA